MMMIERMREGGDDDEEDHHEREDDHEREDEESKTCWCRKMMETRGWKTGLLEDDQRRTQFVPDRKKCMKKIKRTMKTMRKMKFAFLKTTELVCLRSRGSFSDFRLHPLRKDGLYWHHLPYSDDSYVIFAVKLVEGANRWQTSLRATACFQSRRKRRIRDRDNKTYKFTNLNFILLSRLHNPGRMHAFCVAFQRLSWTNL